MVLLGYPPSPVGFNAPVDLAGYTPSGYAVRKGKWDVFEILFERGDYTVFNVENGGVWRKEERGEGGKVKGVGWFDAKGRRESQEDEHILYVDQGRVVVGVFDGHGGSECPRYVRDEVGRKLEEGGSVSVEYLLGIDEIGKGKNITGGSTGNIVQISDRGKNPIIECWNVGDSRAVAVFVNGDGGGVRGVDLSKDHKPDDEGEVERVEKAGMKVAEGRVVKGGKESLGLSRAFGDYDYKGMEGLEPEQQAIVAKAEYTQLHDPTTFDSSLVGFTLWGVVVACDGIWDVMSSQDVANYVVELGNEGKDERETGMEVAWRAVERGTGDNCTVVVARCDGVN